MPFQKSMRILADSSVEIADHKTILMAETNAILDVVGARVIWLVGPLVVMALMAAVGYGAADTTRFHRRCVDCSARLHLKQWLGGAHRCPRCELHRLARLIDEAEKRHASGTPVPRVSSRGDHA